LRAFAPGSSNDDVLSGLTSECNNLLRSSSRSLSIGNVRDLVVKFSVYAQTQHIHQDFSSIITASRYTVKPETLFTQTKDNMQEYGARIIWILPVLQCTVTRDTHHRVSRPQQSFCRVFSCAPAVLPSSLAAAAVFHVSYDTPTRTRSQSCRTDRPLLHVMLGVCTQGTAGTCETFTTTTRPKITKVTKLNAYKWK